MGTTYAEGESAYYLAINRNKRSVALDLSTPEGRRSGRRLAERADVVVENFKPGTMARLGLSYEKVSAVNPGSSTARSPVSGRRGRAVAPGYDFIVQAVGGLMHITGPEGGGPDQGRCRGRGRAHGPVARTPSWPRCWPGRRSGGGQRVEVDLMSCLLAGLVNQASTMSRPANVPQAIGNRHPAISPYEMFSAADRPLVVAVGNDRQFAGLAGVLEMDWLASDERFAGPTRPACVTATSCPS